MLNHESLLAALADGNFHSGEELGALFSVSRAAIWKQMQQLEAFDISIESVRGKGYRLPSPILLLSQTAILDKLSAEAGQLLKQLHIATSVTSSNSEALAAINHLGSNNLSGHVFFAEHQSAGRGRRGRQWQSPLGCNIYSSIVWRFEQGVAALEGLSLAVGVVIVEMLESLGYSGVELKWPNDILYQNKKLGGILVEISGDINGVCDVVIGIGLNVCMSAFVGRGSIADPVDSPWVDLLEIARESKKGEEFAAPKNRNFLSAALLNFVLPLLHSYEKEGFVSYKERWLSRRAFRGQTVNLYLGNETIAGELVTLGEDGSVGIQTSAGVSYYNGGEISLRLANDS